MTLRIKSMQKTERLLHAQSLSARPKSLEKAKGLWICHELRRRLNQATWLQYQLAEEEERERWGGMELRGGQSEMEG